jgi:subtilisin family serine protease
MPFAIRRRRAVRVFAFPSIFQLEPIERRLLLVGTISGTVFSDYDSDGTQDGNEPGLAGWTVYIDANDNNIPDTAEQKRTTDVNGFYEFAGLAAPATYNVREVLQNGYQQTIPGTGGVILGGPGAAPGAGDDGSAAGDDNVNRPFTKTEIVVAFRGTTGRPQLVAAVNANPNLRRLVNVSASTDMFTVPSERVSLVEVKLPAGTDPKLVVQRFEALPSVAWAQPNYIYEGDPRELTPNDPQYGSQYHHPRMQNNLAWDTTLGDPRVTVAVTDDGVDFEHQDLYLNIFINQVEIPPSRLANLTDLNGDGYISMVELQDPTNRGAFKANDINSDGRITPSDLLANMVKDGNGNDTGNGGWSDQIDQGSNTFIDDLVGRDVWSNDNDSRPASSSFAHGTHVAGIAAARTNNATGVAGTAGNATIMPIRFYSGSGWTSTHVANAYRYATSNGADIVSTSYNVDQFSTGPDAIFAAGLQFMYDNGVLHFNSQGNNATLLNPPRQRWDQSLFVVSTDQNDLRSSFSKYGWGADISAPGSSILSTLLNNTYGLNSGTSMATPNVAGVAALVWSQHPEWTREQVASAVTGTADPIDAINPSFAGLLGTGRVNAFKAVTQMPRAPQIKNIGPTFPAQNALLTSLATPFSFTLDVGNIFDPATTTAADFEIRASGPDGQFDTSDDRLVPFNLTFGSANWSVYMIGTNRLNFSVTTAGVFTPDTYRFSAKNTLVDPFGQPIDGNADGSGGDAFTRSFTILPATNRYTVNLADGQSVTNAHFGNHDIVGPRALASGLAFATSPHRITVQFNEDVSDSLTLSDLAVQNLTTGLPLDTSAFSFSYDTGTNTATWNVNGILPDARLRGTIAAAGVSDRSGNALDGDGNGTGGDNFNFDFFFLMADANHDGRVNLDDFNIVAANFGQTGTDFTRGDFSYDGQTNLDDFNIFAARFGNVLAGPSATASSGQSTSLDDFGDERDALDDLLA